MVTWLTVSAGRVCTAAALGLCLLTCGCSSSQQRRIEVIRQEAADAEVRADETLAADLEACAGDPDCRRLAIDAYAQSIREIQAKQDQEINAELERGRQ
jgi:hypothetical protein